MEVSESDGERFTEYRVFTGRMTVDTIADRDLVFTADPRHNRP